MDIILRDIYYLRKLNFETRQLHVFSVRTGIAVSKLTSGPVLMKGTLFIIQVNSWLSFSFRLSIN